MELIFFLGGMLSVCTKQLFLGAAKKDMWFRTPKPFGRRVALAQIHKWLIGVHLFLDNDLKFEMNYINATCYSIDCTNFHPFFKKFVFQMNLQLFQEWDGHVGAIGASHVGLQVWQLNFWLASGEKDAT